MKIGLRIDVDTFRGTESGVPSLLRLLDRHGICASFFFSVGPDNMGRHLWRVFRPRFAWKMLRTRAPTLYGWDILLRGTLWPGPIIGERLGNVIRSTAQAGHEVGLHAWDHHFWQTHIDRMSVDDVCDSLRRGVALLGELLGQEPCCSAVPGWRCNDLVLAAKEAFGFRYNSDCRGSCLFQPLVEDTLLDTPQIPIDLPTYDETVGRGGVTPRSFNGYVLSLLSPDRLNTLTIHAEVEGMACLEIFDEFLTRASERGGAVVPLGALLNSDHEFVQSHVIRETIPGREGWIACQATS